MPVSLCVGSCLVCSVLTCGALTACVVMYCLLRGRGASFLSLFWLPVSSVERAAVCTDQVPRAENSSSSSSIYLYTIENWGNGHTLRVAFMGKISTSRSSPSPPRCIKGDQRSVRET